MVGEGGFKTLMFVVFTSGHRVAFGEEVVLYVKVYTAVGNPAGLKLLLVTPEPDQVPFTVLCTMPIKFTIGKLWH